MKILVAAALALAGCATTPTPRPQIVERILQVPTKVRCATAPPPATPSVARPKVCGVELVCYTAAAGQQLYENVEAMQEWIRLTWGLCKP